MTPPAAKNGMATAGMICGIVGVVLCWFPFIGLIAALLGIVFGALGMGKAGKLHGVGRGAGIAGLVCGIAAFFLTGLMAAIAIPAFVEYMEKGKKSEVRLQLRRLETRIRSHYIENAELPASTDEVPGRAEQVCDHPDHKHPVQPIEVFMRGGWSTFDFWIDTPSRHSYKWTRETATRGTLEARSDADCDGIVGVEQWDFVTIEGNLTVDRRPPTDD